MGKPIIGKDAILAMFPVSSWDAPTFTVITEAKDVSMPGLSKNAVSLASRGSKGFDLKGAGLKAFDLQFGFLYETESAQLKDLRESWLIDTNFGFAVLDGPTDGVFPAGAEIHDVQGWKFIGQVFEFPIDQALEEGVTLDIKVEATRYKNAGGELLLPEWIEIAGSNAI